MAAWVSAVRLGGRCKVFEANQEDVLVIVEEYENWMTLAIGLSTDSLLVVSVLRRRLWFVS